MDRPVILALSGGNALGAYHGGVYEALCGEGIRLDRIVGASIGAVMGAIIAGNPPEQRLDALRRFWRLAGIDSPLPPPWVGREEYNGAHLLHALLLGRPRLFRGRFPGALSLLPGMPDDIAIMDHHPAAATLEELIDFDRLNKSDIRLTVGCLDIETGEERYFDTHRERITSRHLLASTGVMPLFPPVEIDGRLLGDLFFRNNLPLDVALVDTPEQGVICIASELFPIRGQRPVDMAATLDRGIDLLCAGQTQRTIAALRREHTLQERSGLPGRVDLLHVAYQAPDHDKGTKTLNFAARSLEERWQSGLRDMRAALTRWRGREERGRFAYVGLDQDCS